MSFSKYFAATVLAIGLAPGALSLSSTNGDNAVASFYWDCCKASCSWADHGFFVGNPINTCDINGTRLTDWNLGTGCNEGESFSCQDQLPWAVNDTFAYGFAGAYLDGYLERTWCCGCYELEFTNSTIAGKKMIVQASNSNYDAVGFSQFNIGIPGGYDYASACRKQFGASDVNGKENDGVLRKEQCDLLPENLREACQWRFDWMLNIDKPSLTWKRVACPVELTRISGCLREDEADFIASAQTNDTAAEPETEKSAAVLGSTPAAYTFSLAALMGLAMMW